MVVSSLRQGGASDRDDFLDLVENRTEANDFLPNVPDYTQKRVRLCWPQTKEEAMINVFVVKCDGKTAAMANNFDSAIVYAERLKGDGHRITIRAVLPQDVEPEIHSMLREGRPANSFYKTVHEGIRIPSQSHA